MRSDFFLFFGIFVFIFILWVYSGGPTHPISFAGPYLTPVTNVGGQSEAYGPTGGIKGILSSGGSTGSSGTIWGNWQAGWGTSNSGSTEDSVPAANRSPYAGKVYIDGGSSHLGAKKVSEEYIGLRAATSAGSIGITGWQLVSSNSGARTVILRGTLIARESNEEPITLLPGDGAIISSGSGGVGDSFKETVCTGYLDRATGSPYYPALSTYRCPSPLSELGLYQSGTAAQYNRCADYVRTLQSCRVPDTRSQNLSSWCENFVSSELTYSGCVRQHKNDSTFFGTTWRIFQDRKTTLWRSSGDTITLYDQNEKVVDQYSY